MTRLCPRRALFSFWLSSGLLLRAQAQICYFPGTNADQDKAVQQFPCDPYAFTTQCCPLGWTCFSNNLCVVTDETAVGNTVAIGTAIRGACTNPLWNNTACGDFCLDELDNGSLQSCGDGNWCCQSSVDAGNCDCETGEGTFSIPDGEAQTIVGVTSMGSSSAASSSSTSSAAAQTTPSVIASSTPSTSSSSSRTSRTSTSSSSRTSSSPTSTSKSVTALSSSSSSSHISSSHISSSSTSHTGTSAGSAAAATSTHPAISTTHTTGFKAGIAVASIIVFAILAFLLWFFCVRKRNRRNPTTGPMSDVDSDIYTPEPTSAVPGPILRPSSDPYEGGANDGLGISPVSERGNWRNSGWSGGFAGGFAGRATDERLRPVANPRLMPYEGT